MVRTFILSFARETNAVKTKVALVINMLLSLDHADKKIKIILTLY